MVGTTIDWVRRLRQAHLLLVIGLAASSCGCCPGCFPLLPPEQRIKTFSVNTTVPEADARKRLEAWFTDNTPIETPSGAHFKPSVTQPPYRPGTGLVRGRVVDDTIVGSYYGHCISPPADPADPPWVLMANVTIKPSAGAMTIEFRDIVYNWHSLGDNPSVLTHGNRRAPRTTQDLENISKNCLEPLRDAIHHAAQIPSSTPTE